MHAARRLRVRSPRPLGGLAGPLLCAWAIGCGATAPKTGTFETVEWNACSQVFTKSDTEALHAAGQALGPLGACRYEGVYVRGWQAVFAFATTDGAKAESMPQ